MNKRFWFLMVTLLAIAQGTWAQSIPYVDRSWDEATQRVVEKIDTCKDYKTFGGYDEWFGLYDNQWYVVRGHVRQTALNVLGDAHIILCDNAVLEVKHIKLEPGNTLHIHGQQRGNGRLVARNTEANGGYTDAAGIGGGSNESMGNLHIHGGNVIAHGNRYAAGIGGGKNGHGGLLVVYGGYVEGHAGADAAGIGGGETGNGEWVKIYGGTVWGWGYGEGGGDRNNCYGAGIGGGQDGNSGNVEIFGGKVNAYGGMDAAGIGTGEETTGHSIQTNNIHFHGGTIYAEGRGCASGIGSGEDASCGEILIFGGTIHAKGGSHEKAMAMGSYDNHDETTIGFANQVEVWSERSATRDERSAFCRYRKEVWIAPCDHNGTFGPATITDNGNGTHTLTCNYCMGGTFPHTLEPEGFCTLCSYDPTGSLKHTVTTEGGLHNMVKNGAVITLGTDINLGSPLSITDGITMTLDLNGHTLSRSLSANNDMGSVIRVEKGGTLTVKDSSGNNSGKLTGGRATNGGGITNHGTLTFEGGTITDCSASNWGGGIFNAPITVGNTPATMTMTGGVIDGCLGKDCGGIFNYEGCTLTISGGTIHNCSSDAGGGAVVNNGTLTISGGIFTGNRCQTGGGGVWNNPGATLTITGGTIMDNSADLHGGGIYSNGSFKMSGTPFITGNTVNGGSENLYLEKGAVITVIGRLEDCSVGVTAADMSAAITKDYSKYNTAAGFIFGDGGITTELRNGELYLKQGDVAISKGTGTDSDPYLLEHSGHWQWLAQQVSGGNTFEGKTLRMTTDIDASGTQIAGTFKGTFDGGGHTLRYNVGSDTNFANTDGLAPFNTLQGATIRHLRIGGTIFTQRRFAAGLAVTTEGTDTTTVLDVRSSISIRGSVSGDATHAGLITQCYAPTNFEQCSFLGSIIAGNSKRCAGMVGWTDKKVSFKFCFVDPTNVQIGAEDISDYALGLASGTFIRMKMNEGSATFEDCYYTNPIGTKQGTAVFSEVRMPQGCSATIEGEPVFKYDGKNYYKTGTIITTITPDNYLWFHHWVPANGVFISDPFAENGRHRVEDLNGAVITLDYTPYEVKAETEREYFGTVYRWLSRRDYHLYISEEYRQSKGWYWENDDEDANLIMEDNGEKAEITVVTGYNENNYEDGGLTYVMNDCVGSFHNHTHLAAIAPRAYAYSFGLKRLRFMDSDADIYNQNTQLRFYIDEQAFLGCENLEQLQIVQYTTEGSNHYEPIRPDQIVGVALNAFEGCSPRMSISTHENQYQNFMSSEIWSPFRERLVVHEFNEADFTEYGVKYRVYKDSEERDPVKNDESGLAQMRNVVKWWNSEYQNFNAVNLLTTYPDCNVYYASIVGVDDDDIDDMDGVMRIYNDIGSYYNYKTIQLGRDAIRGNEHVKYIEFWQTDGRSENSYSDLKIVIPNGALAGMKNLKELRLFYYEQDGDDHWTALGPKDVIPGNNIFGNLSADEMESMSDQAWGTIKTGAPEGFKIIVSSDRMAEFIDDPNWQPYIGLMECRDDPNNQNLPAFRDGNVVYDYVTAPGGIIQTTQVASQDVSWFTLPRIVAEVALWSYALYNLGVGLVEGVTEQLSFAAEQAAWKAANFGEEIAFRTQVPSFLHSLWNGLGHGFTQFANKVITMNAEMIGGELMTSAFGSTATLVLSPAGKLLISTTLAMVNMSIGQLGFNLDQNRANLARLRQLGVIKDDKFVATEEQLKAMSNKDFMILAETLTKAVGISYEAARRNQEDLMNRLNEQMSLVDPNWNGPAVQQMGMNALTAGLIAQQAWGVSANTERINKGMREQIRSNMNQSSMGGGGYVFYHLQKNLVRHTYVKYVDDVPYVTIHVGHDDDGNANTSSRVTTFGKNAFRNKGNLQSISFYENTGGATSNASSAFLCVIPDSAFVGCPNLRELNLILETEENGERALGPENFIFGGDSIFCTVDSTKFHIVIDPSRKDDFLASESWKPLAKYFTYREAVAKNGSTLNNYGAWYAYAYENNSIKKEHKKDGHLIQHVFANEADNDFLEDHNGALKITVDIGSYNNYQTDYVRSGAFRGNQNLRYVNFTDLDLGNNNYSDFEIQLKDYCFADCRNLKYLDLLFLKTDGTNKLLPITPQMLKAGRGILDNTNAKIRMMPQQVKMFEEADSNWTRYKDRFMPCIIKPADEGIKEALEDAVYTDMAAVGTDEGTWTDFIDLSYFLDNGHLSQFGRLLANKKDKIRSFADFKHFESIGLDHIGASWFDGLTKLSNITLPNTAKRIEKRAFAGCTALKQMTLPTQLTEIQAQAFDGCTQLNTIVVPVGKPATLTGAGQFYKHAGLRIFVPDSVVSLYKQQWAEYKDYIVSMKDFKINKVVTVTQPGQLAEKLGLTIIEDATTIYVSQVRWVEGPYAMYDSLTVIGPLNGRDMSVIRYLAGADAWNSDRTDGNLRYLNLWNADLKKDTRWSYNNDNADDYLTKDNWVGDNLFENCEAIETIILPKSATAIGEEVFENTISLKRIAIGRKTTTYDEDLLQDLDELGGIEEVVFLTEQHASSDDDDAWDAPIQRVYVPKSQIGIYMNDNCLTSRAQSISSLFDDEHVMYHVAEKGGLFFPSEIRATESIDGIFTGDTELKDFSEFQKFVGVKQLGSNAFSGCSKLKTITLPGAVEGISTGAFDGCTKLDSIRVNCDSIFTLEPDVFESLPADFRIYVPKTYITTYQERWSQYKEHIVVDESSYSDDELITVTLTEPNTLHEKLGLQVELSGYYHWLEGVKGDYSRIKKLKVIGPISGTDFELMRYLAGYTLWTKETNYVGQLEYLDLYDAQIRKTDNQGSKETRGGVIRKNASMTDDVLHEHALKRASKLKTLILPKTCKEIETQALVDCSELESIVFGDDIEEIDWTCFEDDPQLTYAYFLSIKKPKITWDYHYHFNNNYAPTCDAFYVRPSQYRDYLDDTDYTNNSTSPLTNLISRGAFNEDEAFVAFGSHATASLNDLITVKNVDNWFDSHRDVKDLTQLRYTKVKRLRKDDFQKLTQLERIALPISTEKLEEGIFQKSPNLRFVDFLAVEPSITDSLKDGGLKKLGIDLQKTLAYVPMTYGLTEETNVVYGSEGAGLMAHNYRLYDGWDYTVPYAFKTQTVENSRTLAKSDVPYTVCLPYKMDVPYGVKAYQLSDREGSQLLFKEISELTLEPMQPYLLKVIDEGIDPEHPGAQLTSTIAQEIPASGGNTFGRQIDTYGYSMRGTFDAIDNKTANELNAYVLKSDGKWYLVGNDTEAHRKAYIPAYRCYLLLNGGNFSRGGVLDMELEDNPTAIEEPQIETVKTIDGDGTEQIFDLSGRKLQRIPERGIYIRNGRKVVSK